ncbi:flagellin [Pseudobutyrivibrio sp. YE44]|uniref:flagellin n=1 Tax=Pseudobutyrivibrio sp. YE44 TaxID=1520802 RepID=UPI00088606FA|nr:flagellin [Pseudobutyrivibrio sp. YE44]SDB19792.1 flagellin [Pseudobutyrivibrio sp. YE44]
MKIQSNVNTVKYQNHLNSMKANETKHNKAAKELATGKKVNTAADDATALAISQQIMKEASSLKTGSNNISYGIGALNVADGAMANIGDSLGDIQQNTIRAMNGLYSESDRNILQEANRQSVETINHTINQAKYNEKNLLDGSSGDINIYTGASSSTIKEIDAKAAMADLENFDISGNPDKISTDTIDKAYSDLNKMRSQVGAETNGLESAYNANNNTVENLTAAQARKEDADFYKSVTDYKNSGVVGAAQNMTMKNQMESQENLVNKLFQG